MTIFKKIYYYDLRAEASDKRLSAVVGRGDEMQRLTRVMNRRINNNSMVVGPNGIGKTALIRGWVDKLAKESAYDHRCFIQLDAGHIQELADFDERLAQYQVAYATLPLCTLFVDDVGAAVFNDASRLLALERLYGPLLKNPDIQVIFSLRSHEFAWLEQEHPGFLQSFEVIKLKNQSSLEQMHILEKAFIRLNQKFRIIVPRAALKKIIEYGKRFSVLGQAPRSMISLLDECLAHAAMLGHKELTENVIQAIVTSKTGVPIQELDKNELETLQTLETELNNSIINQRPAIKTIITTIQRAKLGMRNPDKPLGSFLILGPSGVGKTETAKLIAEKIFGKSESFTRFDMSEFSQEHTVGRLIGAPPGYLGYDAGGALTNALSAAPHSLILLDEIEKAHPKIFDIFLQVLDDGRLTSGQNETVDARHAVIMATSNLAVLEILEGWKNGADIHSSTFLRENIIPVLTSVFRLEFLNRFDNIVIFNPLSVSDLIVIAQLEVKKIEQRVSKYNFRFNLDSRVLGERIKHLHDPRFGARPVKRFVEEVCETLTVQALLKNQK